MGQSEWGKEGVLILGHHSHNPSFSPVTEQDGVTRSSPQENKTNLRFKKPIDCRRQISHCDLSRLEISTEGHLCLHQFFILSSYQSNLMDMEAATDTAFVFLVAGGETLGLGLTMKM